MGNRAVITVSTSRTTGAGIYVHWNGGPESVQAFLDVAKARGYRCPGMDPQYATARLCSLICEFFADGLSVGVGQLRELDTNNFDNGVYVIGPGWTVIDRWGKGSEPMPTLAEMSGTQRDRHRAIIEEMGGHTCAA